jgi:hypothetical protein
MDYLSIVGNIHITHEPGLKSRYFAAPNLVVQHALGPLKTALLQMLSSVPWDCTHDQRKPDRCIREALANGRNVHSVDLSAATDGFPFEFQRTMLHRLTGNNRAKAGVSLLNAMVSQGHWEMPDEEMVHFWSGQPLGLGPSFPMFAMAHGLLLYILNGYKWSRDFYVLGDDVIIFDDALAHQYRKTLGEWGVTVSEHKSFNSSKLAQFAGVTYTADRSFWVPKWNPLTKENLLDAAAWWYPGLTKGMPDHELITRVLALPAPYGKGWNPKSQTLDIRFPEPLVDYFIDRDEKRATKVKPKVTRPSTDEILTVLRRNKVPEHTLLRLQQRIAAYNHKGWTDKFLSTKPSATALLYKRLDPILFHGTEAPGYPLKRFISDGGDPWSVGNIRTWKKIFVRIDKSD